MKIPLQYRFTRYLASKKSVDDRALNKDVWNTLRKTLPPGNSKRPVRILEIGAGIGTMIERAFDWGLFKQAEYTAIDSRPENISAMLERLNQWALESGGTFQKKQENYQIESGGRQALLSPISADIFEFTREQSPRMQWDLLIAHAVLDLLELPTALPELLHQVRPDGWIYFTINFDGLTSFEPSFDPVLDEKIERLYHRTMDERIIAGKLSGDSRTGRHLFTHLRDTGVELIAAGASDWVVFPHPDGYPEDEAYFLHFIIHTIEEALRDHPELSAADLLRWVDDRHRQIENHSLNYVAHQIDFFGQVRNPLLKENEGNSA